MEALGIPEELRLRYVEWMQRIFEANDDLELRIAKHGAFASYDREMDTLAIRIGEQLSESTLGESVDNAIVIQLEPESLKIVGVELLDFNQRYAENPPEWRRFLKAAQLLAADAGVTSRPIDGSMVARLAEGIRELAVR